MSYSSVRPVVVIGTAKVTGTMAAVSLAETLRLHDVPAVAYTRSIPWAGPDDLLFQMQVEHDFELRRQALIAARGRYQGRNMAWVLFYFDEPPKSPPQFTEGFAGVMCAHSTTDQFVLSSVEQRLGPVRRRVVSNDVNTITKLILTLHPLRQAA